MTDQSNKCDKENIIRQLLKVQAQITVTPLIKHGNPKVTCINSCIKPNTDGCDHKCHDCDCCDHKCHDCDWDSDYDYDETWESGKSKHKCDFTLTQIICVEIPISVDADVDIKEGIVCCGRPDVKPSDTDVDIKEGIACCDKSDFKSLDGDVDIDQGIDCCDRSDFKSKLKKKRK